MHLLGSCLCPRSVRRALLAVLSLQQSGADMQGHGRPPSPSRGCRRPAIARDARSTAPRNVSDDAPHGSPRGCATQSSCKRRDVRAPARGPFTGLLIRARTPGVVVRLSLGRQQTCCRFDVRVAPRQPAQSCSFAAGSARSSRPRALVHVMTPCRVRPLSRATTAGHRR